MMFYKLFLLYDLKASLFLLKCIKGRFSIGTGRGIWAFEIYYNFRIFKPLARPALYELIMTFYSFFNNMRCKETRKREKHTAPSTKKKLTQKCPKESDFRIFKHNNSNRNNSWKRIFAFLAWKFEIKTFFRPSSFLSFFYN